MPKTFAIESFFPRRLVDLITEVRVSQPEVIERSAARRQRRSRPTRDGKLTMLACDHPARGVTASLDQPLLMADRQEYLGRAVRALLDPGWDGVMAAPDLVEDLLILDHLLAEVNGPSLLDGRLIVGCMNRGGIHGVAGEILDRFTGSTAHALEHLRLDGGKMLIRAIANDERTLDTVALCAEAVTSLARRDLLAFVEPLPMKEAQRETTGEPARYTSNYSVEELVKWVSVCAALGETSRHTWIKIPYVTGFERVARATTLPILVLGGPAQEDPSPAVAQLRAALDAGRNVRGAMFGRTVLFPGAGDPLAASAAVNAVVHRGADLEAALRQGEENAYRQMDALTRVL